MPQENSDPRATAEKILDLEAATGFRDTAVTSGLEAFAARYGPDAAALVDNYANCDPAERERRIARLRRHLGLSAGESRTSDRSPHDARTKRVPRRAGTMRPDGGKDEDALRLPVAAMNGVGAKRALLLERLGITTVENLLYYLPRKLEDRSRFVSVGDVRLNDEVAVRGRIKAVDQRRMGRGMTVVKAAVGDGTGFLYATWFNQPWLAKQLHRGDEVDVFGRVEFRFREWQMQSPVWEAAGAGLEIGRLVPIYPATEGLSDRLLRSLVRQSLERHLGALRDVVPADLAAEHRLLPVTEAISMIHCPASAADFERARRTLAFEELFLLQVGLLFATRDKAGTVHTGSGLLANSFLAALPIQLTQAQGRALREIKSDLSRPVRMMRLLQGDVGSGKTLVAVIAALHAIEAGFQVALMAPTEILAEQHAANLARLLSGLPVRVAVLTGGTAAKEKEKLRRAVEAGEVDLVVGTHALIQETVAFRRLGLAVIDEQHRFGVIQRSQIEEKGRDVDLLVMSATPIPRTIALTLYGEFDVSVLDEFPLGEKKTRTDWVAESRRDEIYGCVGAFLADGRRGYVVLPLVEESEKIDAKAAVQVAEELRARFGPELVGLLHGRLSSGEKSAVMERFRSGEVCLLVSTTVVEVGVDVLDADFMVIEHADRFGLSQLHQLRGRIGRAGQEAVCFALADTKSDDAARRLAAFRDTSDGFAIAEEDLRLRGPGDLLGTHQHGFLTQLRAANLLEDVDLMRRAQAAARTVRERGASPELLAAVERRFGEVIRWLRV
jgi:ATP-dependent DNA helicase RecG